MPDRSRLRLLALSLALGVAIATLSAPALAVEVDEGPGGRPVPADVRPGESCPDATAGPRATDGLCDDVAPGPGSGGAAGIDLAGLLPFLAAGLVGAILAIGAGLLVLRRRLPPPMAPAGPGEWWTCPSCSSTNIVGSPRCYRCGTLAR